MKADKVPTNKLVAMTKEEREVFKAQVRMRGMSNVEKIKYYYESPYDLELPSETERIHARALLAYHQMLQGKATMEIVRVLRRFHKVNRRTAFADIDRAREIWGDLKKTNKEIERAIVDSMAKRIFQQSIQSGDLASANKAAATLVKAHNLDKEVPDLPDFTKLDPSIFVTILDPQGEKITKAILERGIVNLSDMAGEIAEDIDFQEVSDEEE